MSEKKDLDRPQVYWRVKDILPEFKAEVLGLLEDFYIDLVRFNQKINLIAKKTELEGDIGHIVDCLLASKIVLEDSKEATIYDLGAGNGLPGIIIALLDPRRKVIILDTDDRKCEFLKYSASRMKLANVEVKRAKLEELPAGSVKCAVTRGMLNISKTILMARKPFAVGGSYYHLKGSGWLREVSDIPSQICSFWAPGLVKEYDLPVIMSKMAVVRTKRIS